MRDRAGAQRRHLAIRPDNGTLSIDGAHPLAVHLLAIRPRGFPPLKIMCRSALQSPLSLRPHANTHSSGSGGGCSGNRRRRVIATTTITTVVATASTSHIASTPQPLEQQPLEDARLATVDHEQIIAVQVLRAQRPVLLVNGPGQPRTLLLWHATSPQYLILAENLMAPLVGWGSH